VLNVTKPVKLQGLLTSGVGVGVGEDVGCGVGVYVKPVTTIETLPQRFVELGVGVTVGVGVFVGVTVGVGVTAQSKIASKSILQTGVGVGVGGRQGPDEKKSAHKSGQELKQGDFPNNKQVPPKVVDKHQQSLVSE
jgi:hypothetical protein